MTQQEAPAPAIETVNDQIACITGEGLIGVLAPVALMSKAQALRHAAWLIVLADPMGDQFPAVLAAVRST